MRRVLVINGPNLNLLGSRQPAVYGTETLAELVAKIEAWGEGLGLQVDHFQSNHEGELVDRIQAAATGYDGIVINPGALTHYARSLADALAAVKVPAVEVHISNIGERETWRRHSVIAPVCVATFYGRGLRGYRAALAHLVNRHALPFETIPYGPLPDQVSDWRRPAGSARGTVVLIPGGLWRHEWTRDTTESMAVALTTAGWHTWNVSYRRLGRGGGWPQSFDDVVTAVATVAASDPPSPLVVAGHSAGGTMALWVGKQSQVDRLVSMAGITDLGRARRHRLGDNTVDLLLGRRHPSPPEYDPMARLPTGCPTVLVACRSDALVDLTYARSYADAARRAGDEVELVEVDGGHSSVLDPSQAAGQAVLQAVESTPGPLARSNSAV
jgi:3-dehydroquinate dehydratase-2